MSKIVIADSSCLIGLSKIGRLSILPQLFGKILIPPAVFHEVVVKKDKEGWPVRSIWGIYTGKEIKPLEDITHVNSNDRGGQIGLIFFFGDGDVVSVAFAT